MWSTPVLLSIYSVLSVAVHGLGILNAAHAVMTVRSSRSAIAWSISLVSLPWITIPLYWTLGKNKFQGYSEGLQKAYDDHSELVQLAYSEILEFRAPLQPQFASLEKLAETFSSVPFTTNNSVELLIDGAQTYGHMLAAIANAKHYILFQTYIIHSDEASCRFRDALIAKAKQGVSIHLLYDGIGARTLSKTYIASLEEHGIAVKSFRSTKGFGKRFQINFRNHRKILIVDGDIAFMGGLNIGDEYLGKDPKLGSWRDTHLQIEGTAVKCLQRTFLADWYWAAKDVLEVSWTTRSLPKSQGDQTTFILSTGPADRIQACALFFITLINQAKARLWIASPYFVPSTSVLNALKLAALRGVDVRIILPNYPDHLLVFWCSFSYYEELRQVGIQVYRYQPGFMHQKVILCDRDIAGIGTTNLDNRSFFLNFEVMLFVLNEGNEESKDESAFINSVEKMLTDDLESCNLVDLSKYQQRPFWFKLAARVSRLLAPIL